MADKYHSDTQEKIESIVYTPSLQDTSDLETATKTITATAEATGVANADYGKSLTLLKPTDDRLVVLRIAARLAVTIDTIPAGDTNLYCRVYVDNQATANRLLDLSWNSTGQKLSAVDTHSGNLPTIFALLSDGSAHTFYFFFWKAGTGTGIIISEVRLWEGVGTKFSSGYANELVATLSHKGMMSCIVFIAREGTGTPIAYLVAKDQGIVMRIAMASGYNTPVQTPNYLAFEGIDITYGGSVETDLNYISKLHAVLRSFQ
jgi:hypothetical protein